MDDSAVVRHGEILMKTLLVIIALSIAIPAWAWEKSTGSLTPVQTTTTWTYSKKAKVWTVKTKKLPSTFDVIKKINRRTNRK